MLIGVLLVVSWAILMIRYPMRAIPISLGALLGLGLVAAWVIWQEQRESHLLAQLEVQMHYSTQDCAAARPLHVTLTNHSAKSLKRLRWEVAAYSPGSSLNLVGSGYEDPQYQGSPDLQPNAQWQTCLPLPPIRAGYRASQLEFRAERLRGSFSG